MPLKVDHIRPSVYLSSLILFDRFAKGVSRSLSNIDMSLSRIPRRLPISIQLKHEGLFLRESDREVIKFEHVRPTFSVERLRTIRRPSSSIKKFVPFLFTPFAVAKTRANSPMERFISERLRIAGTAITATESAVESQKKDSTKTGIDKLSVKIKSRFLSTKASTSKTDSGFGVS